MLAVTPRSYDQFQSSSIAVTKEAPAVAKKPLDKELIEGLMDVLPEMRKLEEVVDHFYNLNHDGKRKPLFSNAFVHILESNPTVFQNLNATQKAQILFDKYREVSLDFLSKKEAYQSACRSLLDRFAVLIPDHPEIDSTMLNKIKEVCVIKTYYNGTFVSNAIRSALNGDYSIQFSFDYNPMNLQGSEVLLTLLS